MRLPKRALSTRRLNFMLVVWTGVILGVLGGSSVTAASEEVPGGEVLSAVPGLSLYTHEKHGEILIRVAETVPISGCSVVLRGPGVGRVRVALQQRETVVPFDLAPLANGLHRIVVELRRGVKVIAQRRVQFLKAPPAENEVKIDYRTRGLIVDGKPFFPFGFYWVGEQQCLDTEMAFKFNLLGPYGGDKQFLDRCDAAGIKMSYSIQGLAATEPSEEKQQQLEETMKAMRGEPSAVVLVPGR